MSDVVTLYEQSLAKRGFVSDASQRRAVERLQRLYEEWSAYKARRSNALKRMLVKPPLPKGVYLWGAVGRGKSFLMDSFYLCVPLVRKRRVHFHHFMREIHREMNELKGDRRPAGRGRRAHRAPLPPDLLRRIPRLGHRRRDDPRPLPREGDGPRASQFVMTSNYHPDQLYPNGLQRERFLPAIELLKARLDVVNVDGGKDYRRLKMEKLQRLSHRAPAPRREMARIFEELKDVEEEKQPLDVEGRRIPYRKRAGGLVWFDFAALCGGPRSYADYVDLARRFHTVILSGVPKMSPKNADSARRFTWLVDVFYDDRVKLFVARRGAAGRAVRQEDAGGERRRPAPNSRAPRAG